jgi:hypothetical protein
MGSFLLRQHVAGTTGTLTGRGFQKDAKAWAFRVILHFCPKCYGPFLIAAYEFST